MELQSPYYDNQDINAGQEAAAGIRIIAQLEAWSQATIFKEGEIPLSTTHHIASEEAGVEWIISAIFNKKSGCHIEVREGNSQLFKEEPIRFLARAPIAGVSFDAGGYNVQVTRGATRSQNPFIVGALGNRIANGRHIASTSVIVTVQK